MMSFCIKSYKALENGCSMLIRQRRLIVEMTRRELNDQYAGQLLGYLWSILHPIIFISVYIFIFGVVFSAKIGGTYDMPLDYTTYILSGLVPWLAFQSSLAKTSIALTSNSSLVKQVVFPLEVLPIKMVFSTCYTQFVSVVVLFFYVSLKYGLPMPSYFLLPVLMVFQFFATLGVGFILAATTPFFRDVKDVISVYAVIGIYLVPVVYLPQWMPSIFKSLIYANPVSYMIWCYQDVLYFGRMVHPISWVIFSIGSLLLFSLGLRYFQKVKYYVGNVL